MLKLTRVLILAASGVIAAAGSASAQDKIVVAGVGAGSATHWPVYIAEAKGFFKDANLTIDWIGIPSSASVMQQLAAGSINMASSGLVDALRAADKGAPTRLLRVEASVSPYEVIASPSIKTWGDLRKKTVMIGGQKDITRIYFEDMAEPNGLKPGEYDYLFAGSTAARFAALASGSVAATIVTPPFNFKAASEGYTSLGLSAEYTKDFPFTGYSVNLNWAKDHKKPMQGFLEAYSRGVQWFNDTKNRDEAISILVKKLKASPEDVAKTYDFFAKIKLFDKDGDFEKSGISKLIAILKKEGEIEGSADLSRFYDPSLRK